MADDEKQIHNLLTTERETCIEWDKEAAAEQFAAALYWHVKQHGNPNQLIPIDANFPQAFLNPSNGNYIENVHNNPSALFSCITSSILPYRQASRGSNSKKRWEKERTEREKLRRNYPPEHVTPSPA